MDRRYIGSILFLLTIAIVKNVNAFANYKWIPLKSGDPLPENAVLFKGWTEWYIGRSTHYNETQLVYVNINGSATTNNNNIESEFEILTSTNGCGWLEASQIEDLGGNLVRLGTNSLGEDIFLGNSKLNFYNAFHEDKKMKMYTRIKKSVEYLYCNTSATWIEYLPNMTLPNNLVSGGLFENSKQEMFVARWRSGGEIEIGQFIPQAEVAEIIVGDKSSEEFEFLIGEPNQYRWIAASYGTIPEYAVTLFDKGYTYVPSYVARIDKTISKLTHWMSVYESHYEILVINQPNENILTSTCSRSGSSYFLGFFVILIRFMLSRFLA